MSELGIRVLADVHLYLFPVSIVIANFFTGGTNC